MNDPDHVQRVTEAISDRSDLELVLSDGRSIKVHSEKLSMASSVLRDLMDVMEEQLISFKRQRTEEGAMRMPTLNVRGRLHSCLEDHD